jgi:hypothetical protein
VGHMSDLSHPAHVFEKLFHSEPATNKNSNVFCAILLTFHMRNVPGYVKYRWC